MRRVLLLALCLAATPAFAQEPVERLLETGRLDEAVRVLEARTRAAPHDAHAFHLLTRAHFHAERYAAAAAAAQKAAALAPDHAEYQLWLGRAVGEQADDAGIFKAARLVKHVRAAFEKAVQLAPQSAPARSDLAEFYMEAPGFMGGGLDKARAQAEALDKINHAAAHWVRARIAEKEKNFTAAETELKAALQDRNESGERWLDLASFYRRQSRWKEFEEAIQKAIEAAPANMQVQFDAADQLVRARRNFPLAKSLLERYLASGRLRENAPAFRAHSMLGFIVEKNGDKKKAAEHYRAALALVAEFKHAREGLERVTR